MNGTVATLLLQEKDGRYFWAVVWDRDGDEAIELVGRDYPDVHEARDAAYRFAQEHGAAIHRWDWRRNGT
jgi:hypothetical protein